MPTSRAPSRSSRPLPKKKSWTIFFFEPPTAFRKREKKKKKETLKLHEFHARVESRPRAILDHHRSLVDVDAPVASRPSRGLWRGKKGWEHLRNRDARGDDVDRGETIVWFVIHGARWLVNNSYSRIRAKVVSSASYFLIKENNMKKIARSIHFTSHFRISQIYFSFFPFVCRGYSTR